MERFLKINKISINEIIVRLCELSLLQKSTKITTYLNQKDFQNENGFLSYVSALPSPLPENSLSNTHKDLSAEWDYEKN